MLASALVQLFLLTAASVSTASSDAECFSLRGSMACPGYEDAFLSADATNLFSWYPNNDVKAFDAALTRYVGDRQDTEQLQVLFRCPGLSSDDNGEGNGTTNRDLGRSNVRYRRSVLCGQIIAGEANIKKCYGDGRSTNNGTLDTPTLDGISRNSDTSVLQLAFNDPNARQHRPLPLCKTTCHAWARSIGDLIRNETVCPPSDGVNRKGNLDNIYQVCDSSALNGKNGECISGEENEQDTCGYKRVEDWCRYCEHAYMHPDLCEAVGVPLSDLLSQGRSGDSTSAEGDEDGDHSHSDDYLSLVRQNSDLFDRLAAERSRARRYRQATIGLGVLLGILPLLALPYIFFLWRRHQRARSFYLSNISPLSSGPHNEKGGSGDTSLARRAGVLGRSVKANSDSGIFGKPTFETLDGQANTKAAGNVPGASQGSPAKHQSQQQPQQQQHEEEDFVDIFLRAVNRPREVVRAFFGRREDEISLQKGDVVQIQMVFDDGWVVGRNMRTGEEGSFPLMCIMTNLPTQMPSEWTTTLAANETRRSSIAKECRNEYQKRRLSNNGGTDHRNKEVSYRDNVGPGSGDKDKTLDSYISDSTPRDSSASEGAWRLGSGRLITLLVGKVAKLLSLGGFTASQRAKKPSNGRGTAMPRISSPMAHNPSSNPTIPTNSSLVADPPNSAASPRPVSTSATTATLGVNQSQSNAQYFDSNHFAYEHYHYPLPVLTEYYQSHNASSRPVGGRASSKTPSPAPISTAHHRLVRDGPTPISTRSIHKISSVPSFSASTPTTNIDTHGDVPNSIKRTLSDSDFKQGNARKAPAIGSYHQRMHSKPLPAAPVTQPGARPQRQEPRSSRPHKSITNIASPTAKSSTPSPPRQQHHGSTIYSSRNLSESTAGSSAASRYASSVSLPHSRASDDKPRTNVTLPATERCSEGISSPVAPLQHR